jgi:cell division septum initiation protein DivIVA
MGTWIQRPAKKFLDIVEDAVDNAQEFTEQIDDVLESVEDCIEYYKDQEINKHLAMSSQVEKTKTCCQSNCAACICQ